MASKGSFGLTFVISQKARQKLHHEGKVLQKELLTPHARLQTPPVLARRLAEMLGAVTAEIGKRGEVHTVGYLRERQALVVKILFQDGHRVAVDETADAVPVTRLTVAERYFGETCSRSA